MDDGILIVGLVFGIGVDDDALFGRGRERDIEDGKIAHWVSFSFGTDLIYTQSTATLRQAPRRYPQILPGI
jgi:hypothetical protein